MGGGAGGSPRHGAFVAAGAIGQVCGQRVRRRVAARPGPPKHRVRQHENGHTRPPPPATAAAEAIGQGVALEIASAKVARSAAATHQQRRQRPPKEQPADPQQKRNRLGSRRPAHQRRGADYQRSGKRRRSQTSGTIYARLPLKIPATKESPRRHLCHAPLSAPLPHRIFPAQNKQPARVSFSNFPIVASYRSSPTANT